MSKVKTLTVLTVLLLATVVGRAQQTVFVPSCSGNASLDTANISAIVSNTGSNDVTIKLPYKSNSAQRCTVNTLSLPTRVTLDNTDGSGIKVVTGQTLTIAGPRVNPAGKTLAFNVAGGQGTLVITGGQYLTSANLSVAPASASNPIAVAIDDYAAMGHNGVAQPDVAPAVAALPTFVGLNSRRVQDAYNVKATEIGAIGDGVSNDRSVLNRLANTTLQLTGEGGDIYFPAGTYLIGSAMTFPLNVRLIFDPRAMLKVATGQTVAIQGAVVASPYQIFINATAGLGKVSFANNRSVAEMPPQWWGAVGDGVTNSNAAIQAAIQAAFERGGGTVFFPMGVYIVDGTLDPVYNSLLKIPDNGTTTNPPVTIQLVGEYVSRTSVNSPPTTGVIISAPTTVGSGIYPAILAAYPFSSTATGNTFNQVVPIVKNVNFRTSDNPTLTAINFHNCIDAVVEDVMVDTGTNYLVVTEPTHAQAAALVMPGVNNNTESHVENFSTFGYFEGIRCSEHVRFIGRVSISKCHTGLNIEAGFRPITGEVIIENCPFGVFFGAVSTVDLYVSYERYDVPASGGAAWWQSVAGQDISEAAPGNGFGTIRYKLTIGNVGSTPKNLSFSAPNMDVVNVYKGNYHSAPMVVDAADEQSIYLQTTNASGVVTDRNMSPQVTLKDSHYTVNAYWNSGTSQWLRSDIASASWDFFLSRVSNAVGFRHAAAGANPITWTDVMGISSTGATTIPTSLAIGGGTALTKIVAYAPSLTPASVAANTSAEQDFTVSGLTIADKVIVNGPAPTAGTGIVNVRVKAANTLSITFGNFSGGPLTPTSGTYQVIAIRN